MRVRTPLTHGTCLCAADMAPKRKAAKLKQSNITDHNLPLLKKPMEAIGKQINVPGEFWEGAI